MFRGFLPEWLYKALPSLYVVSGLATLLVLRNAMGVFGGMMLISAGAVVWFMRKPGGEADGYVPRRENARSKLAPRHGFVQLVWKKEYECGHPVIDSQHRGLFATANALFDAIAINESAEEVEDLLEALLFDVQQHFETEEKVLAEGNLDEAGTHAALHRELLAKATTLANQYREGKAGAGGLISFVVYDLVGQHITKDVDWIRKPGGKRGD
jgi:hemerythrin-like metal-binding protein